MSGIQPGGYHRETHRRVEVEFGIWTLSEVVRAVHPLVSFNLRVFGLHSWPAITAVATHTFASDLSLRSLSRSRRAV